MSAFFHTYILRFTGFWLDIDHRKQLPQEKLRPGLQKTCVLCQDGNKNYSIEQNAPTKQGTGTHTIQWCGFKLVKGFMTPLWWIIIGGISGVELTPISGMLLTRVKSHLTGKQL
jgi:hypothetical protein